MCTYPSSNKSCVFVHTCSCIEFHINVKALAYGCSNALELVSFKGDSGKPYLKQIFLATVACVCLLDCVEGGGFPVIPFTQPKSKAWVAYWSGGAPMETFLSTLAHCLALPKEKAAQNAFMMSHPVPGFMAYIPASRAPKPVSMEISALLASLMQSRPGVSPCCALSGKRLLCGNFLCSM